MPMTVTLPAGLRGRLLAVGDQNCPGAKSKAFPRPSPSKGDALQHLYNFSTSGILVLPAISPVGSGPESGFYPGLFS